MAAEVLAKGGVEVTILDHMPSPARKFLLAGRGGLNLTHSEPLETFLTRYGEAKDFLEPAIRAFPPQAVIDWCNGLGIETFVGSSGRVFPKQMKASPLLRAWLRRLDSLGVTLKTRESWQGFDGTPTILAMGGASWPHLGSDAAWVPVLRAAGIRVNGFKPANSRFLVNWTPLFRNRFAGTPVKNVGLTYANNKVRGELMISQEGIEGGAIYALSRFMREAPGQPLQIDLRPDVTTAALAEKLAKPRGKESLSTYLRKTVGLPPVAISLFARNQNPDHRRRHQGCGREHPAPRRNRPGHFLGRRCCPQRSGRKLPVPEVPQLLRRGRNAGLGSPHRRLFAPGLLLHRRGRRP